MNFKLLVWDEAKGSMEMLWASDEPDFILKVKAQVAALRRTPTTKFFIPSIKSRTGPKGRPVIVTKCDPTAEVRLDEGLVFESASEASTAIKQKYNGVALALRNPSEDKRAVVKGVTFMYEDDYIAESLAGGIRE